MNPLERIRESKWLEDYEPPRSVCVAGAAVLPPFGVAVIVGLFLVCVFYGKQVSNHYWPPVPASLCANTVDGLVCWANPAYYPAPSEPNAFIMIVGPLAPYLVVGLLVASIWVMLGMWAYIHCHQFWHGEKPEFAKDCDDRRHEWRADFMYCPECYEIDPDTWHELGHCLHFGTTP